MRTEFKKFVAKLQRMENEYNVEIERKFNVNTFTPYPRKYSRYLTFVLYKAGVRAPQVLFSHFIADVVALYFVFKQDPIMALVFWLTAHILDNCDGDIARIRDEVDMKWAIVDNYLHLVANMAFWVILFYVINSKLIVIVLSARVICEWFRGRASGGSGRKRWGEKSAFWKWVVWPTNVNIMYLTYVPFALFDQLGWYVLGYAAYLVISAGGQSVVWLKKDIF